MWPYTVFLTKFHFLNQYLAEVDSLPTVSILMLDAQSVPLLILLKRSYLLGQTTMQTTAGFVVGNLALYLLLLGNTVPRISLTDIKKFLEEPMEVTVSSPGT